MDHWSVHRCSFPRELRGPSRQSRVGSRVPSTDHVLGPLTPPLSNQPTDIHQHKPRTTPRKQVLRDGTRIITCGTTSTKIHSPGHNPTYAPDSARWTRPSPQRRGAFLAHTMPPSQQRLPASVYAHEATNPLQVIARSAHQSSPEETTSIAQHTRDTLPPPGRTMRQHHTPEQRRSTSTNGEQP